jgi:hypothetical protein
LLLASACVLASRRFRFWMLTEKLVLRRCYACSISGSVPVVLPALQLFVMCNMLVLFGNFYRKVSVRLFARFCIFSYRLCWLAECC